MRVYPPPVQSNEPFSRSTVTVESFPHMARGAGLSLAILQGVEALFQVVNLSSPVRGIGFNRVLQVWQNDVTVQ